MNLRILDRSDAAAFRALRLFGLQESPTAFGSSFEEEQQRTLADFEERLIESPHNAFFGAFHDKELVGIVGVGRNDGIKDRHVAFVRSMYVHPQSRGSGLGRRLLEAALDKAFQWPGVEQVSLEVTATNVAAITLYLDVGFLEVGRMPRMLRVGDEYFDELTMVLRSPPHR